MNKSSIRTRLDRYLGLEHLEFAVPEHGKSPAYTFGGVVFSGFILMVITGILLTQFYNPVVDQSYGSLQNIEKNSPVSYLRALHYWVAQGVVFMLFLHMSRVFITGAFKRPRQVIWWLGVALFATMVMGSYFSGTVLKWDLEGADALEHYLVTLRSLGPLGVPFGEGLPGEGPINLRIYVSHITIFPAVLVLLIGAHFYLIHIFNLSPTPFEKWSNAPEIPPEEIKGKFSEHARTILIFSLVYYGLLAVIAYFVRAPLLDAPSDHGGAVKPPWPFLWMYGLENVWGMQAILYTSIILFGILFLIPLLDRKQERRLASRKGILFLGALLAVSFISLTVYGWYAPLQTHHHGGEEKEHKHMESAPGVADDHEAGPAHTHAEEEEHASKPHAHDKEENPADHHDDHHDEAPARPQ